MKHLQGNYLQRWVIPFGSAAIFFFLLAFLIPYSSSLWAHKKSLAGLIVSMADFGQGTKVVAPLDYSYCLLVPPISAYLVYLRWNKLQHAPISKSNAGLWLVILGVLFFWFGMRSENQYFGYLALQTLLAGVILWLWGWAVFRIVLFPWAFIMFTWPLPFLDPIIAFPLRMMMSTLASHILPLMGIPCIQNGTALLSPPDIISGTPLGARYQIDIADPCSGIRSLFALLMFSALFGYLFLPRLWQQWTIFLSAFPMAILGNLARVIMLVLGSIFFGSAFAIGTDDQPSWFHEGCGYLIYAVALGAEFGLASLLTHNWNPPAELSDADEVPA
jgi:exosortase